MELSRRVGIFLILLLATWTTAYGQMGQVPVSAVVNVTALRPGDDAVVGVVVDIPDGLHAQSHHPVEPSYIALEVVPGQVAGVRFDPPVYPAGKTEKYPGLGVLNVYTGKTVIYVPVHMAADARVGKLEITGTITYQVCNDQTCFFPQMNKPWSMALDVVSAGATVSADHGDIFAGYKAPRGLGPDWGVWTAFGAAFLAGLLFNVMPCVLPVLPLKAVGFYEVSQHRRGQAIAFGAVFSLGLIAVFGVLAILVPVLKIVSWGGLFSHGWFVWTIVAILFTMGLSLLDVFTFNLPPAVYSVTPRHDTYVGNFLFGSLTAVLATPCTAPLLPPLLLWAASRPGYMGVPAMLMVGVGMASPYMVLSAFPEVARRFPRAGAGAMLFKQMMAFLLLVAATYFASGRLIEGPNFWWIVTTVIAIAACFLMARTVQISKGSGAIVISSILAVGMVAGAIGWSARVTGLGRQTSATAGESWTPYSTAAFDASRKSGKPVLVEFTANWCATCQIYIEGVVFADPAVWNELHNQKFTTFKADFSRGNPEAQKLLLTLNPSGGIPLTAVYLPDQDQPVILDGIYTIDSLMNAIAKKSP